MSGELGAREHAVEASRQRGGGGRGGQGRKTAENGEERQREPTHTLQNTRAGNRAQPREPRREDGGDADETEKSAAPDARPMSEITIARHKPKESSTQRQCQVKSPVPTRQG